MTFFFIFFICYPLAALPLAVLYLLLPVEIGRAHV